MTRFIVLAVVILIFIGVGFFLGWHTKPDRIIEQPNPAPAEAYEVTAEVVETNAIVTTEVAKHITVYDTVLVTPPYTPPYTPPKPTGDNLSTVASHPFYFSREGASFEMDITYRYRDKKFRFENMRFKAPKPKVVYKQRIFAFGSACGLLTDSEEYSAYFQPVIVSVWRFDIYPTILIDDKVSYGVGVGIGW